MNYHRWTRDEIDFLKSNYKKVGDTHLAVLMQRQFPRSDTDWNKKHIEKKRRYLKLKRTKKEESRLRKLNNKDGRHFRAWKTRGSAKNGDVRIWNGRKYIKVKGKFELYNRVITKAKKHQIARETPNGIVLISRKEHAKLNKTLWQSYSPELKETVKLQKITNGKKD